jgi:hypothetical protein
VHVRNSCMASTHHHRRTSPNASRCVAPHVQWRRRRRRFRLLKLTVLPLGVSVTVAVAPLVHQAQTRRVRRTHNSLLGSVRSQVLSHHLERRLGEGWKRVRSPLARGPLHSVLPCTHQCPGSSVRRRWAPSKASNASEASPRSPPRPYAESSAFSRSTPLQQVHRIDSFVQREERRYARRQRLSRNS